MSRKGNKEFRGQIWKGLEKVEIGFPALLVKQEPEEDEDQEELSSPQLSLLGPAPNGQEEDSQSE